MSQTDSGIKVGAALYRVQIRVMRWANRATDGSDWLIDPHHLAPLNRALDECVRFMESRTIPTLRPNERLIPKAAFENERWLFDVNRGLTEAEKPPVAGTLYVWSGGKVFLPWRDALRDLKRRWETNVREAESRLGDRFREADFPRAADLYTHFIAWGEYDGNMEVTSPTLLGPYSIFEPPPPPPPEPPSILEGISFGRELTALYELRRSGKLTEQEFRDRFEELKSGHPFDGRWGKS